LELLLQEFRHQCSETPDSGVDDLLRGKLQATLSDIGLRFEQPHADGLHLLRHTSGSLLYRRSDGDLKTTQEWLGHSNSRITADVYVHTPDDQQRKDRRIA